MSTRTNAAPSSRIVFNPARTVGAPSTVDAATLTIDAQQVPLSHVIIDCSSMCFVDVNGLGAIKQLAARCNEEGVVLFLACCKGKVPFYTHSRFDEMNRFSADFGKWNLKRRVLQSLKEKFRRKQYLSPPEGPPHKTCPRKRQTMHPSRIFCSNIPSYVILFNMYRVVLVATA